VSDAPQWPRQYLIPPYSRAAATASFACDPSFGQGERTVFPCTKSAVIVGGDPCGDPLWMIQMPQRELRRLGK
jgi:hypothetical protein